MSGLCNGSRWNISSMTDSMSLYKNINITSTMYRPLASRFWVMKIGGFDEWVTTKRAFLPWFLLAFSPNGTCNTWRYVPSMPRIVFEALYKPFSLYSEKLLDVVWARRSIPPQTCFALFGLRHVISSSRGMYSSEYESLNRYYSLFAPCK